MSTPTLSTLHSDGTVTVWDSSAPRRISAADAYLRSQRLLAVAFARRVQLIMRDLRSIAALDVAYRHAKGKATDEELATAHSAARDAAWSAANFYSKDGGRAAYAAQAAADAAVSASAAMPQTRHAAAEAVRAVPARSARTELVAQGKIMREMLTA
jgi:hypothetical protein